MVSRWFLCTLFLAQPAFAQSLVTGTVTDPQSAVIPDAHVSLLGGQVQLRTTRTDAQGRYRFEAVQPGTYVVIVTARGFQQATSSQIVLTAGQEARRDISLALADATDFVTVEGRAREGYRVESVTSLGSLGAAPLLDTPYTLNVLPSELMVNGQVKNFKEASKYLPLVEFQEMQGSEILRPATRGMQGSNMQNARMDGMGIVVTGANSMESLQQIEVLNGIGGGLYGPANPSGMFNFVPKRPTETPVRRLSLNYDGSSIVTGQVDVGGRVGDARRFGYRVNALGGDGGTFVNNGDLTRSMVSLAGDVRPFDRTVVEAFYSHYNLEQRGFPGWFTYGRANRNTAFILVPEDAPDPTREGYGQPEAGVDLESRIGQLRLRHDFNSNWRLSVGALDQLVERDISTQVNALTDNTGNYTASLATGFAPRFRVFSNLSYLNGRVMTGNVSHDVAFGITGYTFKTYSDVTNPPPASVRLGTANIASPVVFGLPSAGIPTHTNLFMSSSVHQQGVSLADTVALTRAWSIRVALSQDWIWTDNYNNSRVRTGGYDADGVSPLVSVMYKPRPGMTLYATVGSSLQQGDIAPTTAVNAGQGLEPYRTHQQEIGYKLSVASLDFSTAWFRLERPFANTDPTDNVFKISGDQVNYGIEATVTGRVGTRLTTYGGGTVLDPKMTKTLAAEAEGRHFVGIPAWKSNLLTEYRLAVGPATFVMLNWQLVGERPIDDANTAYTPAYNVVDAGIRYAHPMKGVATTWRLNVNNIGDAHYWSTLGPGNITGTNVGSYTAHLGQPRTVAASMEVAF
jgi:iron complex outermembrane recepter protein